MCKQFLRVCIYGCVLILWSSFCLCVSSCQRSVVVCVRVIIARCWSVVAPSLRLALACPRMYLRRVSDVYILCVRIRLCACWCICVFVVFAFEIELVFAYC